jgi:hypothetical protein
VTVRANGARIEVDPDHQLVLFDDALPAPERGAADPSAPDDGSRRSNGGRARLTLGEAARIIRRR